MYNATKFEAEPHRTHMTHDNTVTLHNLTFSKLILFFIVSFFLFFFFLCIVCSLSLTLFFENLSSLFSYLLISKKNNIFIYHKEKL